MTSPEFEHLVRIGKLQEEPRAQAEIDGLVRSARSQLTDAGHPALALESRFDLAYNAAHALALAALRWRGYRSDNRYIAFQALPHTLGLGPEVWRVLATCHQRCNTLEYEGCTRRAGMGTDIPSLTVCCAQLDVQVAQDRSDPNNDGLLLIAAPEQANEVAVVREYGGASVPRTRNNRCDYLPVIDR